MRKSTATKLMNDAFNLAKYSMLDMLSKHGLEMQDMYPHRESIVKEIMSGANPSKVLDDHVMRVCRLSKGTDKKFDAQSKALAEALRNM